MRRDPRRLKEWYKIMIKECEKKAVPKARRKIRIPKGKKGLAQHEPGLNAEEARQEAERCLGLRACESCETCALFCPDLCITRDEKTGELLIDLAFCKGCGICAAVCPKGAIQMVLEKTE